MAACTPCRASGSAVAETTFQGIHRLASLWLAVMVSCTGPRTGFPPARFLASPGACFLGCTVWPRSFAGAAEGQANSPSQWPFTHVLELWPIALSTLPWKGDKRRLTTRPCNGGGQGRHCNAGRDLGCPAVKSSQGSTHSNGPRRASGEAGRGPSRQDSSVQRATRMNRPRATARRSCCGSRSGRELRRTTSSACA
jgi:hypothetical protein